MFGQILRKLSRRFIQISGRTHQIRKDLYKINRGKIVPRISGSSTILLFVNLTLSLHNLILIRICLKLLQNRYIEIVYRFLAAQLIAHPP